MARLRPLPEVLRPSPASDQRVHRQYVMGMLLQLNIVEQVDAPDECGMSFDDFQGMEAEDRVEAYAARDVPEDDDDD